MSDDDYGQMSQQQGDLVARALCQLTPAQLVKVVMAIEATLLKSYYVRLERIEPGKWRLS